MRKPRIVASVLFVATLSTLLTACGSGDTVGDPTETSASTPRSDKLIATTPAENESNPARSLLNGEALTEIMSGSGLTFRKFSEIPLGPNEWSCTFADKANDKGLVITLKRDDDQETAWTDTLQIVQATNSEKVSGIGDDAYRTDTGTGPPAYTAHKSGKIFAAQGMADSDFTDEQLVAVMKYMANHV